MKLTNLASGLLTCLLAIQFEQLPAQEVTSLPLVEGMVRIDGTSNKNDWTVEVTEMDGTVWLSETDEGFDPDSVFFVTRSGDMKSGTSPIMDRLMYRALKSTQHPEIVYTLGSSGVTRMAAGDTLHWQTTGNLYLAGVADTLSAVVKGYRDSDVDHFVFTGHHRMSMREHGITPPTALFGALHTSEWVEIGFRLVFGETAER